MAKFQTREIAQKAAENNARGVARKVEVLAALIAAGEWETAAVVADYIAVEAAVVEAAAKALAEWPEAAVYEVP